MTYEAPVDDILLALKTAAGLSEEMDKGAYGELDEETLRAVLEEAGKFASEQLAPLNAAGDRTPSRWVDGKVTTPPGWKEAYTAFREAGWSALPCPAEFGGQELPETVATAVCEMWNGANLSFGLCPLLTQGAIDALAAGGSDDLKALYLPRMVSGEWTGTMNLTEPHAGSDLGPISTRAERRDDGTYRIFGTKIFITYGDHDLTENIVHLVLARLPDAPEGTRGISLFVVPKRLVGDDGSLGGENDVICAGLEHKLGIHGSPTAVMKFGERGEGAVGYLVGEENRGLNNMFVMMNAARLAVGIQGVAIAERATQAAERYAEERRQGRAYGVRAGGMVPIADHPDVRRMLLTMKAMTRAARAICYATAREIDASHNASDEAARRTAADRAALFTPVAKAFSTDIGCEVASLGIQVHGGMGFIEETGAAQPYRDARILPIYEGTNGIQAIDLVTRKLPLGEGRVMEGVIAEFEGTARRLMGENRPELGRAGERLAAAVADLGEASRWMAEALAKTPTLALAGATPYLRLFGIVAGGHFLAKAALQELGESGNAGQSVTLARFFAENVAVGAGGLSAIVMSGGHAVLGASADLAPA